MTRTVHGPERLQDQAIGPHQAESAERALEALLCDPAVRDHVDLVMLHRRENESDSSSGHYEVWSRVGMVRFRRLLGPEGLEFEVTEVVGQNPMDNQDPHALASIAEEMEAARLSGFSADDADRRFIRPEHQSYPFGYERVAQLFDSPHAPDLAISPLDWTFGLQPGSHGGLQVRQSRAPLWFSGPGIRPGLYRETVRAVDIAPTALCALGFPLIDGADASGQTASQRGVGPDVYLARQDGRVIEAILDPDDAPPLYLYLFLMDGLHPTELDDRLTRPGEDLPNLRRLRERAAVMASGSIVNFPSITWPSHTTIGTGTWCGHHDVVNPSYYLRDRRKMISPQGEQVGTEVYANPSVESLYEAFARVRGPGHLSAAIHAPFGRGADHAVLERRNLCDKSRLKEATPRFARDEDPRWQADGIEEVVNESVLDSRGLAQVEQLFRSEDIPSPDFVFHELVLTDGVGHAYGPHSKGLRAALDECDRRIGRVLEILEAEGRLSQTLFVVTSDHGMAPQDVSLAANPGRHLQEIGMKAEIADTMVWLRDVRVEIERAADGRTGRARVCDADADPSGEYPPVANVPVTLCQISPDGHSQELACGETGAGGVFGFSTPAEIPSSELELRLKSPHHNPRHVRMDGGPAPTGLRRQLYGQ